MDGGAAVRIRGGKAKRFGRAAILLLLLAALAAAGCGPARGTVSGKVKYDGRPLTVGVNTVTFHGEDGSVVSCVVEADGSYTLRNVPAGPARVTVHSLPSPPQLLMAPGEDGRPKAGGPAGPAPQAGRAAGIPERYQDPDRSRLSHQVRKGEQTFDIELTP
jgi:hypothetical protein